MSIWVKSILLSLALLLIASVPLAMQFETGSLEGVVTDDFGPVNHTFIDAHNLMAGTDAHAESDVLGDYSLKDLRAGHYSLWIQAAGHDSMWIPEIVVERGRITRRDLHLIRIPGTLTGLDGTR